MDIVVGLLFLLLPYLFHGVVTGSLLAGLWIYFFGGTIVAVFIFLEYEQK